VVAVAWSPSRGRRRVVAVAWSPSRGRARTRDGAGLGLSIGRDLARGMDGDLRVQSVEVQGSTFSLTLPVAAPA
jgi:signal transduction histidine kinase